MSIFRHFPSLPIYCQVNSVPEGPPSARLCSGHTVPAMHREYANIPTQCGGLFRLAFIRKTLSSRYFRQCKKLERLHVTWSVRKGGLEKGKSWPGGRNKEFRQSGRDRKGFQANSCVLHGLIRGSEPELSNWRPWAFKGVRTMNLWKTSASQNEIR